ncbi:MAG: stage II sporulation protein R [Clostridia bacterium]|nr:stage II sporulation protein R [Clostridia bacterium]
MPTTKKILICTFIILSLSLIVGLFPVHGESEIYDTVVRLHVLANSDTVEDQALKLKVRDEVIKTVSPAVEGCKSQSEAALAIERIMPEIKEAAVRTIEDNGYNYSVEVLLGEEYYPTKTYESCAFPEGKYLSLRVLIGEGEGENWWCCLFPPLCLSAATDQGKSNEDAFISVGLNADQYKIVTETENPKYKVRFKILETISSWFN